jgi:ferric-dicitrate binding protein FerR (iron transport regulator)
MPFSDDRIAAYFAGKGDAAERAAITAWLRQHPEVLDRFLEQQGWGEEAPVTGEQSERMLANIRQAAFPATKGIYKKLLVAASAAAVLAAAWFAIWALRPGSAPAVAVTEKPAVPAGVQTSAVPATVELQVKGSADSLLLLPDGSRVTMKPGSRLRYNNAYNQAHRQLQLQGEARFDVQHVAELPFMVEAGQVNTIALGTVFTVRAWPTEKSVNVRLLSGKVKVEVDSRKDTYLQPGQELAWSNTAGSLKVYAYRPAPAAPAKALSSATVKFRGDTIEFVKSPVSEVFATLHRQYGIQIDAEAALLKGRYFSGLLTNSGEIEDILETIAVLNHWQLGSGENKYTIGRKEE